jgi:hypothetical protein
MVGRGFGSLAGLSCYMLILSIVSPTSIAMHPLGLFVTARPVARGAEYKISTRKTGMAPVRFRHSMVRPAKKVSRVKVQIWRRFTVTLVEIVRLRFEIGFPIYTTIKGGYPGNASADFCCLHLRDFTSHMPDR